jgi:hypothetical protein
MNGCPNPAQILALANKDPIVRAAVELWRTGKVTWEQAMMAAVATLVESQTHLMQAATEAIMQTPFYFPFQQGAPAHPGPFGSHTHPPQAPPPPPAPAPGKTEIDPTRILHVLVSEICTCGVTHSIAPEDHQEECRGNTLIRRLQTPPKA